MPCNNAQQAHRSQVCGLQLLQVCLWKLWAASKVKLERAMLMIMQMESIQITWSLPSMHHAAIGHCDAIVCSKLFQPLQVLLELSQLTVQIVKVLRRSLLCIAISGHTHTFDSAQSADG